MKYSFTVKKIKKTYDLYVLKYINVIIPYGSDQHNFVEKNNLANKKIKISDKPLKTKPNNTYFRFDCANHFYTGINTGYTTGDSEEKYYFCNKWLLRLFYSIPTYIYVEVQL